MLTFFGSFKDLAEKLELSLRNGSLCHSKTNSKLLGSDKARSESIKVTEEFINANALLLALSRDASDHIINVVRQVPDNLSIASACLGLGVVVDAMVETLIDTKELLSTINIFTEVDIIDFIDIAFVHVTLHEGLQNVLGSSNSKQVEHSQELVFSHMTILRDIIVLEHRL